MFMDEGFPCNESTLSLRDLEAQITELAGHLNAATHRWLSLIAEFDRRKGWSDGATPSCAHWLNLQCGLDLGAAREKVRVAHALERLPKISAAMARGALSYSKARAVTRVACAGTEAYFLDIALHGTAHHVERLVRQYRRAQEAEELSRESRQHARRRVGYYYDGKGSLVLKARLPAEVGALVIQALEQALEKSAAGAGLGRDPSPVRVITEVAAEEEQGPEGAAHVAAATPGETPTLAARRADALGVLAESFLKHGAEVLHGAERHQIVVHVDAHTLREGGAGRCELEQGPALAAETVRRLACDASLVNVLENEQGSR
jgi:hypothetical protein